MAEREIMRRVEAHTGRNRGKWEVDVAEYGPAQDKTKRPVHAVTFSDTTSVFLVLAPKTVTEVEKSMLNIMRKISPFQSRIKRSVRGNEYDFEDFRVRVGLSFDRHGNSSGVVVEIEYLPCNTVSECEGLINVLMARIAAPLVPPPQASQDFAVNEAATTSYSYNKVKLDEQVRITETPAVLNRIAALLYANLLRNS